MSIYLQLFLNFLKIGAVSFGGGYGMIPMVKETVLENGWLLEEQFADLIGVAESTPGPIAINMATYIGSHEGGFFGAVCSTVGVVLPALIIMLIISAVIRNLFKLSPVKNAMSGIRPCVAALIIGTALTMAVSQFFSLSTVNAFITKLKAPENGLFDIIDIRKIIIFVIVIGIATGYKKLRKKKISPILLIVISACLGMLAFGVLG
ncbi:MAG: chromate transporter [Clostridiales bacterium]|nr:chromate transporter [Clostridiales bacterium]